MNKKVASFLIKKDAKKMKLKNDKIHWLFLFKKYGRLIVLGYFIKHKPIISEEWV